jgi:hypothetical protein
VTERRARVAAGQDALILTESITSYQTVAEHLRVNRPALTVICDNRGGGAPRQSALGVHPDGAAAAADDFGVSFDPRR